jgi:hypothetical protein
LFWFLVSLFFGPLATLALVMIDLRFWRKAESPFASPEELNHFVSEVRSELEAAGWVGAAGRFARIQETAFTTGSEWRGDLGMAVKAIRKEHKIPRELDAKLKRILAEVRRA